MRRFLLTVFIGALMCLTLFCMGISAPEPPDEVTLGYIKMMESVCETHNHQTFASQEEALGYLGVLYRLYRFEKDSLADLPPTPEQYDYIRDLGYDAPEGKMTRGELMTYIEEVLP